MPKLLVASSPVEIQAEADEAALPPAARNAALHLFHTLTDRIGQAVVALSVAHEDWPRHRFYFGAHTDLAALLDALRARPDMQDVTGGTTGATPLGGLFARADQGGFGGVLVAHQDHAYHQA